MDVGFKRIKWFKSRSAYQDMQYRRQRRAEAIQRHMDMMEGINAAMSAAQQNRISGLSTLAAQAGIKRVQEMANAKAAEVTKQIDSAQSVVNASTASEDFGLDTIV